jgi:hypothetical protein
VAVQMLALAVVVGDAVTGIEFQSSGDLHGMLPFNEWRGL